VTPSTALRLAKFFNLSADFWANLQMHWNVYHAQLEETAILKKNEPMRTL
jgi:plasmid maintenance system antidote protein VapI